VTAAKKNAGERRGGIVVDQRVTGWVGELHRDDVVLARVSWWRGEAQGELPTVRPKVAAAVLRRR
jgi:hypothetical protein